ncbi:MAG: LytR C-terminal domain-containing protein [Acidimicrobiales bacterium]
MSDPDGRSERGGRQSGPRNAGGARGVLILTAGVVVGTVLLQNLDTPSAQVTAPTTTTTTTVLDPADSFPTPDTTLPTRPARPPVKVRVLVVNASGTNGEASRRANTLTPLGYPQPVLTTADSDDRRSISVVQYRNDNQPEALAVALGLGFSPDIVGPLEDFPDSADGAEGADVVVILGNDRVNDPDGGSSAPSPSSTSGAFSNSPSPAPSSTSAAIDRSGL